MKRTLIFLFIISSVLSACRDQHRKDRSLTLKEYKKWDIPEPDSIWTYEDYSYALAGLTQLKLKHPFALPVKDSKRSGPLFHRMVNIENMSFMDDENTPKYQRAQLAKRYLDIYREMNDLYTDIRMKKQYYSRELLDIRIFGLGIMEKMLKLAEKINKSTDPADIELQSGYRSIQIIYLSDLIWMLNLQKYVSVYSQKDLEVFSDSVTRSVLRNKYWMDSTETKELKPALQAAADSTSSNFIKKKYGALIKML